ncbi:amino acid permease [Paraburkholderia sediminicola]|uniref:amino acid permease n=1 Tax=Paraburkholderia sediminicola TaxID=458836 RepID=UPI0038BD7832
MEVTPATNREAGLEKALSERQITMIGIGGAIGTGLFMGSGIAIGYAGPAVLISYAIAALVAVIMVFSLAEMAVAHPSAGSFGTYAEMYLNPWAGFVVRYTYWVIEVVAVGGEAIAVGIYMGFWFPGIPVWWWSLAFGAVLVYVNCRSVNNFGSFEYWFALIKVVAIVAFIVFGLAAIFGFGGLGMFGAGAHAEPVGMHNLTGLPGGFMPHGFSGVWMGVLMAIFSFYGVEVVAVTSGEARDPQKAIPHALRSMVLRLTLFYLLALGIMITYLPWTEAGAKIVQQSPFVRLFEHAGVRHAAGLMNFVVVTAALSSMNTNLYLSSRMMFSLARGGFAPRWLGKLTARGTPLAATLVSGLGVLVAALISFLSPLAYNYLFGIALFGGIMVWIVILVTHLQFRRAWRGRKLPVRMPFFPYAQILGIGLLAAILITMGLDTSFWNISWIVGVPWLLLVSLVYFLFRKRLSGLAAAST